MDQKTKKIKKIVDSYREVMMFLTVGEGEPDKDLLKKLNIDPKHKNLIEESFKFGKLTAIRGEDLSDMSESEVNQLLKRIRLTKNQAKAMSYAKTSAGTHITSLGNRMTTGVVNKVVENDMTELQGIQSLVSDAMEQGTPRYQLIDQFRELTGDWERDWHRVAHTEMWNAKLNGEVQSILEGESPFSDKKHDTTVFKRPSPNACPHCVKHYLESDKKTPRLFKLSDLLSNGTNVGRKTSEWKPTVGTLHPNCMCPLSVMPDGHKFDNNGGIISIE